MQSRIESLYYRDIEIHRNNGSYVTLADKYRAKHISSDYGCEKTTDISD
jgi:hypothetical protein